jgi:methylthioribose-1-phosphate isomerase
VTLFETVIHPVRQRRELGSLPRCFDGLGSMNVHGKHYQTIWLKPDDPDIVQTIDQRALPHRFVIVDLKNYQHGCFAIKNMVVRGAPLIGATAAWSLYLATLECRNTRYAHEFMARAAQEILGSRPTAVNLEWAVNRMLAALDARQDAEERIVVAGREAEAICNEDVDRCRRIGEHGLELIKTISASKSGARVDILTHCNAGWLATVDWGTATAPIYLAHEQGIPVHVWVDETRPRNQGSQLTAWELAEQGIRHTVIVDNAGGHLMQRGQVDLCITGTDRTTRTGDVANKIGTYLKALAAHDNGIPFYVAAPSASIDWHMADGLEEIPIEERDTDEVALVAGLDGTEFRRVRTVPESSPIRNFAFDVTPARLVTGLITERGVCAASQEGLATLFPEKMPAA